MVLGRRGDSLAFRALRTAGAPPLAGRLGRAARLMRTPSYDARLDHVDEGRHADTPFDTFAEPIYDPGHCDADADGCYARRIEPNRDFTGLMHGAPPLDQPARPMAGLRGFPPVRFRAGLR